MPPAARVADMTGHGPPLNPGPGCPTVLIGYMPAWRALPAGVGPAVESASNAMKPFMSSPVLTPANATPQLVQIQTGLMQVAGAAAAHGNPAAAATGTGALAALIAANVTLTATWTAASAIPGGQPAATQAYTEGMKAAAASAAWSVFSTLAAVMNMPDMHICPIPCPTPPHGPGFVTKGSSTVIIGNLPAARQNDKVFEACGGADPIAMGCMTVQIGD